MINVVIIHLLLCSNPEILSFSIIFGFDFAMQSIVCMFASLYTGTVIKVSNVERSSALFVP